MLKAYALARPLVRFSLKVLKAKNDKENWMYAAKSGATVVDAALKIIGPQVVSQCQWQSWTSHIGIEHSSFQDVATDGAVTSTSNYIIESLLPRKDCGEVLVLMIASEENLIILQMSHLLRMQASMSPSTLDQCLVTAAH